MICMIMGVRKALQDFTSQVGNGSSAHCLFGEAAMIHCISCSVAGYSMSIRVLKRRLGYCISADISPNGCLNGHNLADKKLTETFQQDVDWLLSTGFLGKDSQEESHGCLSQQHPGSWTCSFSSIQSVWD